MTDISRTLTAVVTGCKALYFGATKQYDKAIEECDRALNIEPDRFVFFYGIRGMMYSHVGEHYKAFDDCSRAVQGKRSSAFYRYRRNAYHQLEQYRETILDCNKKIQSDPRNPHYYSIRAHAYEKLGKPDLALYDRERASALENVELELSTA